MNLFLQKLSLLPITLSTAVLLFLGGCSSSDPTSVPGGTSGTNGAGGARAVPTGDSKPDRPPENVPEEETDSEIVPVRKADTIEAKPAP